MVGLNPKDETEFQALFTKFYKSKGAWPYKIRDIGDDTKPFDCELKTKKKSYSIELKYERRKTKIDVESLMRPHQIGNLRFIENLLPNSAYVVTYRREKKLIYIHNINNLNNPIMICDNFPENFF